MKLSAAEKWKEAQQEAEAKLKKMIQQTEKRSEEKRIADVAQARVDERQKTAQEIKDIKL